MKDHEPMTFLEWVWVIIAIELVFIVIYIADGTINLKGLLP